MYLVSLQSEQFILLKSTTCCPIIDSWSIMVVKFVGVELIVDFVGVEFVVIHVVVGASILTKSTYSSKTGSLQFLLFQSGFGP